MKQLLQLSADKLEKILVVKRQIERLESSLDALLESALPSPVATLHRKHRTMSAAARRKISLAAKARWAKFRAGKKK
jgi:hypothetical protein